MKTLKNVATKKEEEKRDIRKIIEESEKKVRKFFEEREKARISKVEHGHSTNP
jgi:hypothetical protein